MWLPYPLSMPVPSGKNEAVPEKGVRIGENAPFVLMSIAVPFGP